MKHETMKAAFMDSFATYGDAIFRFCLVKVSHKEQAEDMTQEVFMRYWQYLRDEKEMTNTRSLLYTIANNLAKDWYKKKKADSLDAQIEAGHEPASPLADVEVEAQLQEVLRVIATMDEADRSVLMLRFVEGLPPREIADILGENVNVISVRINRAQNRLQQQLEHG